MLPVLFKITNIQSIKHNQKIQEIIEEQLINNSDWKIQELSLNCLLKAFKLKSLTAYQENLLELVKSKQVSTYKKILSDIAEHNFENIDKKHWPYYCNTLIKITWSRFFQDGYMQANINFYDQFPQDNFSDVLETIVKPFQSFFEKDRKNQTIPFNQQHKSLDVLKNILSKSRKFDKKHLALVMKTLNNLIKHADECLSYETHFKNRILQSRRVVLATVNTVFKRFSNLCQEESEFFDQIGVFVAILKKMMEDFVLSSAVQRPVIFDIVKTLATYRYLTSSFFNQDQVKFLIETYTSKTEKLSDLALDILHEHVTNHDNTPHPILIAEGVDISSVLPFKNKLFSHFKSKLEASDKLNEKEVLILTHLPSNGNEPCQIAKLLLLQVKNSRKEVFSVSNEASLFAAISNLIQPDNRADFINDFAKLLSKVREKTARLALVSCILKRDRRTLSRRSRNRHHNQRRSL